MYVALMSDAVSAPDTGTELPWRPKEASEISDIHVSSFDRFASSIHAIAYPLTRLHSGKAVIAYTSRRNELMSRIVVLS